MKLKDLMLLLIVSSLFTYGCAGSAAHKVVTANELGDNSLDCEEIKDERSKAQSIIDKVNKDKNDVSAADVFDAVLYFPFNLVAKNQNYNNAIGAADRRITRLNELDKEKKCTSPETFTEIRSFSITEEINNLNTLYKDGALTEEEYISGKKVILGSN